MSHFECRLNRRFWRSKIKKKLYKLSKLGGGGHRALEGGQFRFWSLNIPFYVYLWHRSVIQDIWSHIWWMKKQIWGSKFSKKGPQKQKKWENAQKQPISGMIWCIWATKSVSLEFRHSYRVVFCSAFADQDGWDAE